jgi:hypothetical protein
VTRNDGLRIKAGASFDFAGTATHPSVADWTGWTLASQIRGVDDALLATLTVEWAAVTSGIFRLRFNGSTADWPPGDYRIDIKLTSPSGQSVPTQTETLRVERRITA